MGNFLKKTEIMNFSQLDTIYKNQNKNFMKNYQWVIIMSNLTFRQINLSISPLIYTYIIIK